MVSHATGAEKIAAAVASSTAGGALAAVEAGDIYLAVGLLVCAAIGGLAAWMFAKIDPTDEAPVPFFGRMIAALIAGILTISFLIDWDELSVWKMGALTMCAGLVAWPVLRGVYRLVPSFLADLAKGAARKLLGGDDRGDPYRPPYRPPDDRFRKPPDEFPRKPPDDRGFM